MRRQATVGALLLVTVGVVLGATVFRSDIAQATGLAQAVTVSNTAAQAVPVREQNLDGGNIKVHEQGTVSVRSADQEVSATAAANGSLTDTCGGVLYTVPAGKQLVVKYISVFGSNADATSGVGYITAAGNDSQLPIGILLPVVLQKQYIDDFSGSESVDYVVPPSTEIHFQAAFAGATHCTVRFALGGVLQPAS
jgi:hypothetical protein